MFIKSITESWKNFKILSLSEKAFILLFLVNLLLLLFFGKDFSKFEIVDSVYLNHIFLGCLLIFSLFFKVTTRVKATEVMVVFSLVSIVISLFFRLNEEVSIMVFLRQYALFGYLLISYFIVRTINDFKNGILSLYLIIFTIAILSVVVQGVYSIFYFFQTDALPFFKRHYFSPLVILGIIVATSIGIAFLKGLKKHIFFIFLLLLSFTTGHDSVYLSVVVIYLLSFFLSADYKIKIALCVIFAIGLILSLVFVSSFSDVNASARLYYWKTTLETLFSNGSILYGNGFGIPYLSEERIEKLNSIVLVFRNVNSQYEIPPHNSFLTILFHIGILGLILLVWPFRKLFSKKYSFKNDMTNRMLILALIGVSVWAFFNVIIELPHSSTYYWLIYFTLIFSIMSKDDLKNKTINQTFSDSNNK